MTFKIAVKNVRLKSDPDGKIHLVRVHKLDASKRKRIHAQADKTEAKLRDNRK